jgi:hypothetical protein
MRKKSQCNHNKHVHKTDGSYDKNKCIIDYIWWSTHGYNDTPDRDYQLGEILSKSRTDRACYKVLTTELN